MGFSENLRSIRLAKGMTQYQLAKKIGVRRQTVVDWENPNGKRPDFLSLICLVTALGCSWNKLMDGEVQTVKDNNPEWKRFDGIIKVFRSLANATDALYAKNFNHSGKEDTNELDD